MVFGQVIYGMEVVNRIADLPCSRDKPTLPVNIVDCGEIGDTKYFIRNDPFSKENMEKIKEVNKYGRIFFEDEGNFNEKKEALQKEQEGDGKEQQEKKEESKKREELEEYMKVNFLPEKEDSRLKPKQRDFLRKMRQKINANIEENFELISRDKTRAMEKANAEKTRRITKKRFRLKRKQHLRKDLHRDPMSTKEKAEAEKDEEEYSQWLLTQTVFDQQKKKKKNKQMFGWNVFNEDALYDAHKKRLKDMVTERDLIPGEMEKLKRVKEALRGDEQERVKEKGELMRKRLVANNMLGDLRGKEKERVAQMNLTVDHILNDKGNEDEQRKGRLVAALEKQKEKRDQFKRRRGIDPDSKITYINERNRAYNDKLYRHFGGFVRGIESKLERGG